MNVLEAFSSSLIFFIHIGVIIFFMVHLIRSLFIHKRAQKSFMTTHRVVEAVLMLILGLCFYNYQMSSFDKEKHFVLFSVITLIAVIFYWVSKIDFSSRKYLNKISITFLSVLFWLSFFTFIKFLPYLPFCWFPLLGLYAISPLLFTILTFSEIRYLSIKRNSYSTTQNVLLGLIPLTLIQVIMNFYTDSQWELIQLFNPSSSLPII